MLFCLSLVKVLVWSSGISFAGGVLGGGMSVLEKKPCGWFPFVAVGEDGDNWETKASADWEKMKPRCSSALVTVR